MILNLWWFSHLHVLSTIVGMSCLWGTRDQTQGFKYTRKGLYQLISVHSPSPSTLKRTSPEGIQIFSQLLSPVAELLPRSSCLFDWHHLSAVWQAAQVSCRLLAPVDEWPCPCTASERYCCHYASFELYLQGSWALTFSSQAPCPRWLEELYEFALFSLKSSGKDMITNLYTVISWALKLPQLNLCNFLFLEKKGHFNFYSTETYRKYSNEVAYNME